MSYRSDIAIRIESMNNLDLRPIVNALTEQLEQLEDNPFDEINFNADNSCATLIAYGVRWQANFPSVNLTDKWFSRMGRQADEYDPDMPGVDIPLICGAQFVRIGEEVDDIESDYHGDLSQPIGLIRSFDL